MKRLFEADTICRLCLRVDEKVYLVNNTHHKAFIESIIRLKQSNYAPTAELYVCYICSALLTKSFNFMQTVWSAQKIICAILTNTNMITKQLVYSIDRDNTGLNPITLGLVETQCDSSNDTFGDEPIPETNEKTVLPTTSKDSTYNEKTRINVNKDIEDIDDNFQPDSTSYSEDSDHDSNDDEGKPIKRPKDNRVYPMKCDHCDFELLEKRNHYRHYLFSHPNIEYPYKHKKTFACSICGLLFTQQKISSHEASHTTQELKCFFCPKVFPDKKKRQRHLANVHPKNKLTCDYCDKIFKTRESIIRHIRTHTGSKPFKCHICGEGFGHCGYRSAHIRVKHQHLPKKKGNPKSAHKQ